MPWGKGAFTGAQRCGNEPLLQGPKHCEGGFSDSEFLFPSSLLPHPCVSLLGAQCFKVTCVFGLPHQLLDTEYSLL